MIRTFKPNDGEDVIQVWLASTIPGQSFLPENHWREMEPDIRALLSVANTWVIEEKGEIVAFISFLDNMIGGLFVDPGRQGTGFGRSLIDHARQHFDTLFVEVFDANERAISFYRSCGFTDHDHKIDEGSGLPLLILKLGSSALLSNTQNDNGPVL